MTKKTNATTVVAENTKANEFLAKKPAVATSKPKVYFKDFKTLEDVRKQFIAYVKKAKNAEKSKDFISQYKKAVESVGNKHLVYNSDKIWEKAPANDADSFARMIFFLKTLDGVKLDLEGRLLWASGNTKDNRETLKYFGFSYKPQKTQWVWNDVETKNWRASVIPAENPA